MSTPDQGHIRRNSTRASRRSFLKGCAAAGLAGALPLVGRGPDARADQPKQGGFFRQAIRGGGLSDTLEGGKLADSHNAVTSWMCRNCLTEVKANGEVVGEIAESWEASPGAAEWTVKLRRGIEFHNGKSLDVDDVIYSINFHRGPNSTSGAAGAVAGIADIKADGKDSIVFTLKDGTADFPYFLSDYHLVIVPAGTTGPQWDQGIGTGPYVLTSWKPGVVSTGKRNPNYFKSGLPYFNEVENLNIADTLARTNAFLTGRAEAMEDPDLRTARQLTANNAIRLVDATGARHYSIPMDCRVAPFNNPDVRLALKCGIDREQIARDVLLGHGYLGNDHPIPKSNKFFTTSLSQRQFDPEQVKFHLKQAGQTDLALQLSVADAVPGMLDIATLYQAQLKKVGINLELVRESSDGYWDNVWMKRPFCMGHWNGRATADWMFSTAYSSTAPWNESHWKNERFDALLIKARAELDDNARRSMYDEMQGLVRDDGGAVIPAFRNQLSAVNGKIGSPAAVAGDWPLDGWRNTERWWFA